MNEAVEAFSENGSLREKAQLALSKLKDNGVYYLPVLFLKNLVSKPKWAGIVPVLSLIALLTIVGCFFNKVFFFLLIIVFTVNSGFHYWNKAKINAHLKPFIQVNNLYAVGNELAKLDIPTIDQRQLKKNLAILKPIVKKLSFIGLNPILQNEWVVVVWAIIEYVKITFLLDLNIFYNSLASIEQKKAQIQGIFDAIGFVDSAISIASFRKQLPYYCKPEFISKDKTLQVEDVYNPLVQHCVPNSLNLSQVSVLLTGSNMSGKTTFVRTIGLNSILAQTICTCSAKVYITPFLKTSTSIGIADNIVEGKSYYFEEVESVLRLIKESEQNDQNLFIIDELFKGTNTVERISAAKSVLSYLTRNRNIVIVSTHDVELTELLSQEYNLYHFTETIKGEQLYFDYKLKPGPLATRNAIKLLAIAEYPSSIIQEALSISTKIDHSLASVSVKNNKVNPAKGA